MKRNVLSRTLLLVVLPCLFPIHAQENLYSAELYTNDAYCYGRFEVRMRMVEADGVISSFFLWKDGSEDPAVFWHEIDIEVLGNNPNGFQSALHTGKGGWPEMQHAERFHDLKKNLGKRYSTFILEWTPDYVRWKVNDTIVRTDTGAQVRQFRDARMQCRFNIWPTKNVAWAGLFNAERLPVRQYINRISYARYTPGKGANGSDFTADWEDRFDADTLHTRWRTGSWESPDKRSTHVTKNVKPKNGVAILSLTRSIEEMNDLIVPQDEQGGTVYPREFKRGR